jgi:hypothetical protein
MFCQTTPPSAEPGDTALTVIRCGASSTASILVSMVRAALDTQ